MKRMIIIAAMLFAFTLTIGGCGGENNSLMQAQGPAGDSGISRIGSGDSWAYCNPAPASVELSGYLVEFGGRTFDGVKTTFNYTVSGNGGEFDLSNFFLELPPCAPALTSLDPPNGFTGTNPYIGIYGVKWETGLSTSGSRDYSVTFDGDVPLGIIRTSVKAATTVETGEIAGPCGGYEISGTVYVDSNEDGMRNPSGESGISGVTVRLIDQDGGVQTCMTDEYGQYRFIRQEGAFSITIEQATPEEDFNEELAASFDPTGPLSHLVAIGPDALGNDFGFNPRAEELTSDLETGTIVSDGQPTKFWQKCLRAAVNGSRGKAEYDAVALDGFIQTIQGLYLPEPFIFTPGSELAEALDILTTHSKEPLDILLRELLTAELNQASGRGLVGGEALQNVMLAWSEAIALEAMAPVYTLAASPRGIQTGDDLDSRLDDAISFLTQLNCNIGGGSGGGG